MKRIICSLFLALISLSPLSVQADPIPHNVQYICPNVNSLSNFGTYIAGFGSEILSSRTTNIIYFQSRKIPNNVPYYLINYSNAGTNYDGSTGYVSCMYVSNNPSEGDFELSYNVTNGKGGQIQSRTNNTIQIEFYVG